MTKVDWTRKKTSDSALRSRDIDLVRFYFGNYELIAQRKTSGTVDAFFDLSLYNKGHYTGAYLLLPHHKFVDLMRHLKTITNPAEDDIPPRMPIRMKIDKYLHLEISKSKKLVGECIVIKKVLTESDKTVTPRQIFFPLKVVNNDRLYELMNK